MTKWPEEWLNAIIDEIVGPEHRESRGARDSAARILEVLRKAGVVLNPELKLKLYFNGGVFTLREFHGGPIVYSTNEHGTALAAFVKAGSSGEPPRG